MDSLKYNYGTGNARGNQLISIRDAGNISQGFVDGNTAGADYIYDANGNMTVDNNKAITAISYNHLNLPAVVTKTAGNYINYTYDASGRKLSRQLYTSGVLKKKCDYMGEFYYENDTLKFINHEEGRIVMTGAAPEYQYHLKDHLGDVRMTFTTQTVTKQYTAGFETANQSSESGNFQNYPSASHISPVASNAHSGTNSLYLNGGNNGGQVGLTKSFSVMPGDVVSIQSYAKYLTTGTPIPLAGFATALLAAFNLSAPAAGEVGTARSAINTSGAS